MAASYRIPTGYNTAIDAAAARNGIAPDTLRGVIAAESSFNPNAVSATGAVGLGQVLPSTAARPGGAMQGINPNTLTDPTTNIDFTAQYLAQRGSFAAYSGNSYATVQPIDANGNPVGARVSNLAATQPGTTLPTTAGGYDAGGNPYSYNTDPLGNPIGAPPDTSVRPGGMNPNGSLQPGGGNLAGGGTQGYQVPGLHDWFRRIAIALLAVVMLGVALVAISRENIVGQLRKA